MHLRHARPNRVPHCEQRPQNDQKATGHGESGQLPSYPATFQAPAEVNSTNARKALLGGFNESLAAIHQSKFGLIHFFIIYFLLILFKMSAFLTQKFGRISMMNTFWLVNAPANTQSLNDYRASVPIQTGEIQ